MSIVNPQWLQNTRSQLDDETIVNNLLKERPQLQKVLEKANFVNPSKSDYTKLLDVWAGVETPTQSNQSTTNSGSGKTDIQATQTLDQALGHQKSFLAKTVSNILPSGGRFLKDTGTFFTKAFDIGEFKDNGFDFNLDENSIANTGRLALGAAKNSLDVAQGVANKAVVPVLNKAFGTNVDPDTMSSNGSIPGLQKSEDMASQVGKFFNERYGITDIGRGDFETVKNKIASTISEDPVGFAADIATLVSGGSALVGKAATGTKMAGTLQKVNQVSNALDPINATVKMFNSVKDLAKSSGQFATSQVTGLNPKTIATALTNGDEVIKAFSEGGEGLRSTQANKVKGYIDQLSDEVSDFGAIYDPISKLDGIVELPDNFLSEAIKKTGLTVDNQGNVLSTLSDSTQLDASEVSQIQSFLNDFKNTKYLTGKEFMGFRKKLSLNAKFDTKSIATDNVRDVFKELRGKLNQYAPDLIKSIDNQYSPLRKQLDELKDEYINPKTGELKDSSANKIANLDGLGKDQVLARIRKLDPDIDRDLNILHAVENSLAAKGNLVGPYGRNILIGGGIVSGNFPLAITSFIVAQPAVALRLISAYGKAKGISTNVIKQAMKHGDDLTPDQLKFVKEALTDSDATLRETGVLTERSDADDE